MDEIKVGTKLWVVMHRPHLPYPNHEAIVVKVGRRWLTLESKYSASGHQTMRADKDTLRLDGQGYSSPGNCYRSREAYEREQLRRNGWRDFVRRMSYNVPDALSLEDVQALRVKCGLKEWTDKDEI